MIAIRKYVAETEVFIERWRYGVILFGCAITFLHFTPASRPVVEARLSFLFSNDAVYLFVIFLLYLTSIPILFGCCYMWLRGALEERLEIMVATAAGAVILVELLRFQNISIDVYHVSQYTDSGFAGVFALSRFWQFTLPSFLTLVIPYVVLRRGGWTRVVVIAGVLTLTVITYLYLAFQGHGELHIPHEYRGL